MGSKVRERREGESFSEECKQDKGYSLDVPKDLRDL